MMRNNTEEREVTLILLSSALDWVCTAVQTRRAAAGAGQLDDSTWQEGCEGNTVPGSSSGCVGRLIHHKRRLGEL